VSSPSVIDRSGSDQPHMRRNFAPTSILARSAVDDRVSGVAIGHVQLSK